jgi:hypothetical protein
MDIDAIVKAAVEYVMACGPIWDVENCAAQDAFIAKLHELNQQGIAEKRPEEQWTKTP